MCDSYATKKCIQVKCRNFKMLMIHVYIYTYIYIHTERLVF